MATVSTMKAFTIDDVFTLVKAPGAGAAVVAVVVAVVAVVAVVVAVVGVGVF
jgi:hypothetical protein